MNSIRRALEVLQTSKKALPVICSTPLVILIAFTACRMTNPNTPYRDYHDYYDPVTGYSVIVPGRLITASVTSGHYSSMTGFSTTTHSGEVEVDPLPSVGFRGEPGEVNPAVIEYIFASPEGLFARYYDLVLSLADRPDGVNEDLTALGTEARRGLAPGALPGGRDYARALGRKLAGPINDVLRTIGTHFEGTASVHWGIAVDLDAGIPLLEYERDGDNTHTVIIRYQSVQLLVIRSSATRHLLAWDVSEIPLAFQWDAPVDQSTIAERIVALHSLKP